MTSPLRAEENLDPTELTEEQLAPIIEEERRQHAAATSSALPAPLGTSDGSLDADALRQLAPVLRRDLIESLRHAATAVRQARGTVVAPEDTYDLVRRTVSAGESLRSMAEAFLAAAREADAIAEEEALTVAGVLLVVPPQGKSSGYWRTLPAPEQYPLPPSYAPTEETR